MSNTNNTQGESEGKKKINLAEAMKQQLEKQKQEQKSGSNKFSSNFTGNNKVKSQNTKKSTLMRGRTGE